MASIRAKPRKEKNIMKIKTAVSATVLAVMVGVSSIPHKVNYDLNEGSVKGNLPETVFFWQNEKLESPEKEYFNFTGWTDENGKAVKSLIFTLNDKNLTANYVDSYYSIRFYDNDGTLISTSMYKHGDDRDLMNFGRKYISENHPYETLVGWKKSDKETITALSPEYAGDVSVIAVYEPKQYSVTYELNGGTNADNPTTYSWNTGVESFADPSRDGYTFTGWYSDPDCTVNVNSISADSHEDVTLYAGWEFIPVQAYVQNYTPAVSGGSGSNSSGNYNPISTSGGATSAPAPVTPAYDPNRVYVGGYSATLYMMDFDDDAGQGIVDAWDACLISPDPYYDRLILQDHAYQGFDQTKWNTTITIYGRTYHLAERHNGSITDAQRGVLMLDNGCNFWDYGSQYPVVTLTCNNAEATSECVSYWY